MSGPSDTPAGEIPPGQVPGGGPARGPGHAPDFSGAKIDRLLDAIRQREQQVQVLLGELGKFPAAAERLVDSVQVQVDLANSLDELLAGLADRNEELASMIRSVSETASEQSEILHRVQTALTGHEQTERQIAEALDRLSAAMQAAPDGGGQQALMEQIRENLGRSGVALEKAGQDLVTIAAKSREESKASLDGLAEALRQMPQGSADLAGLLERIHQTSVEFTQALAACMEQIRRQIEQADEQAAGGAQAVSKAFAQDLERLFQDYDRHATNAEKLLAPMALAGQRVARLVRRQNRLLAWLLGSILVALVGLTAFLVARPPRAVPVPFYLRSQPPAAQPASRPATQPAE